MISNHNNLHILDLDIQTSTYFTLLYIHAFHLFNHPWWDLAFNLNSLIKCVMTTYYGCLTNELPLTYNHTPWPSLLATWCLVKIDNSPNFCLHNSTFKSPISTPQIPPQNSLKTLLVIPLLLFTLYIYKYVLHEYKAAQNSTKN